MLLGSELLELWQQKIDQSDALRIGATGALAAEDRSVGCSYKLSHCDSGIRTEDRSIVTVQYSQAGFPVGRIDSTG